MTDDRAALAAEAFIYGFPLVFDLSGGRAVHARGDGRARRRRRSTRSRTRPQLAGPQDTFVSINNDTVYSIAQLDLSGGPVRLRRPGHRRAATTCCSSSTRGRTTSPTSGTARPGTAAGTFLLVPPGLGRTSGRRRARDPRSRPRSPPSSGAGRSTGEEDLPAVRALQAGLTLDADRRGARAARARPPRRGPRGSSSSCACGCRPSRRRRATAATSSASRRSGCSTPSSPYADPDPELAPRCGRARRRAAALEAALTSGRQPASRTAGS